MYKGFITGEILMSANYAKILLATAMAMTAVQAPAGNDINLWKAPRKKLISLGWDMPDPAYIRENIESMEKNAPYDGIAIKVDVKVQQKGQSLVNAKYTNIFQNKKWEREWFRPLADDLKNTKFKKFTDNFILLTVCPGTVDWFDDEAWKTVCSNFSTMAWLAKESGCKGIFLDMEQYSNNRLFCYDPASKHSFEETWAKARERGAQFIQAMTKEYPGMILFATFWLDLNYKISNSPNLTEALKTQRYGLSVPFINGIYDALPPTVKIVEGHEEGGYHAKNPYHYLALKNTFIPLAKPLLAPENINKFLAQTSLAVATFLDCYINESGVWVAKSDEMSRIDLLGRNMMLALKYSDEYSWTWSEQCKWWPIKIDDWKEKKSSELPGRGRLWEDALPGITRTINDAVSYNRDPMAYALARLKSGTLKNIVKNAGFQDSSMTDNPVTPPPDCTADKELSNWQTWQRTGDKRVERNSSGSFSLDKKQGCSAPGAAKADSVKDGCILQSIPVKPGEIYFVRASSLQKGNIVGILAVKWRGADTRWTAQSQNLREAFSEDLKDGWKRATLIVEVPEEVSYMTVLFEIKSPGTSEDLSWLDDVEVYKLSK